MFKFILLSFFICNIALAQKYQLTGTVYDLKFNSTVGFATLRIEGTNQVSTSDENGVYKFLLPEGGYKVVTSLIGYFSDTIYVNIEGGDIVRDVYLKQSEILTEEITVSGEDPAYEIIRNAINYKNNFNSRLKEYKYEAYSKLVLKSNQMSVKDTAIMKDKNEMGIFSILESESIGYFRKPNEFKEIIVSKIETANTRRGVALPFVVNFYDDNVDLQEFKVPGPISNDAFDNYDYRLTGTTTIDSLTVFKIEMKNKSELVPQFSGTLYILDSIFALMKIDLTTNNAAKLRFFSNINFKQSFSPFTDTQKYEYWLPTDNQINGTGSLLGFLQFKAEVFSVVKDYQINIPAPPGTFDKYIIKVQPGASKDSSYWAKNRLIEPTPEEEFAYKQIEINEEKRKTEITISPTAINFGENFASVPLSYYHYNRVEGNFLGLNLRYRADRWRTGADGMIGYGLDDQKLKYELSFRQRLLPDRSLNFGAGIYRKLTTMNFDVFFLARFYNSMTSLGIKDDQYDYMYNSGWFARINYSPVPLFRFEGSIQQEKQQSAFKNTNFSFLKNDQLFKANPPINDAFSRSVGFSMRLDPNKYKYIDWGDDNESRLRLTNFPTIEFSYENNSKNLGSTYDFRKYSVMMNGRNRAGFLLNVTYKMGFTYLNGEVPYQSLAYFNANPGGINPALGFKVMRYQEYLGDKLFYLNIENDFGKLIWGNFPLLNTLNFVAFYNAGRSEISAKNFNLSSYKGYSETSGIYQEAGVGIGGILSLFRLDFAWRLNNFKDGKNFNVVLTVDNF
ncbi:MAG: carboxypeptidase-like regulatory domain-containing protein [Ignavibacteria bacterium]|nr:carboxypeptidase-like regulatory domain-containing protein [Ignavibacteria bacterium]